LALIVILLQLFIEPSNSEYSATIPYAKFFENKLISLLLTIASEPQEI